MASLCPARPRAVVPAIPCTRSTRPLAHVHGWSVKEVIKSRSGSTTRWNLTSVRAESSSDRDGTGNTNGPRGDSMQGFSSEGAPSSFTSLASDSDSVGGGTVDMMRLFNDAQQNMLFLNRQRLVAVEELHKAERELEFLQARVSQLEAENQAGRAENEVLEQRLRSAESALDIVKSRGAGLNPISAFPGSRKRRSDPPSIWSAFHVRIDAMLLSAAINEGQAKALRQLAWRQDHQAGERFLESSHLDDRSLAASLLRILDSSSRERLHIVQVCSELAPVAQAGSVGPWLTGLCRALRRKGHLVEVVMPKYSCLDASHIEDFRDTGVSFSSFFGGEKHANHVWSGVVHGLPVTFIEPVQLSTLFEREHLYGYDDDFERFSYFSRATLEWLQLTGKQPHILHLHNWHTAVIAPLFWDHFCRQSLAATRILFTCHNFKYQHLVDPKQLALCGLDPAQLLRPDRLQDGHDTTRANILKGGIVYSNFVSTVSSTYAWDVKRGRAQAQGLESTIATHEKKIVGIPSGFLDLSTDWAPERDRFLPQGYSVEDLAGKAMAKRELQQRLGLPLSEKPMVVCLLPSVQESHLQLISAVMDAAVAAEAQFVALGASKVPKVQAQLEELQRDGLDEDAEIVVRLDEALVHLSLAAADIFMSLDDQNPISQFHYAASAYGSIPLVRLPETMSAMEGIVDYDQSGRDGKAQQQQHGPAFVYHADTPADLSSTLRRAIDRMRLDPGRWAAAVTAAMEGDFSWDGVSSSTYVDAYQKIILS